jgi:hypothetical protein
MIYYNSDRDQIYLVDFEYSLAYILNEVWITESLHFCHDCSFWHYIGRL